ncbi:hypothetical protein PtA15_4A517 [Puccinia triticina]|uniref:Uncharacterized protein n=1 Tax=Puccinia triticina TaxID=208348 RepID=A0ABY7CFS6_9BASI|nr:uncharacterized protein PtA15_4A517 [Puccinia triticina]WAQ84066.1 hypothetical protein PtA15_4A517 [Puccinia triticina]WAR54905.1 hypothetical protein PtB15_4B523 [Puccinia triticina]
MSLYFSTSPPPTLRSVCALSTLLKQQQSAPSNQKVVAGVAKAIISNLRLLGEKEVTYSQAADRRLNRGKQYSKEHVTHQLVGSTLKT